MLIPSSVTAAHAAGRNISPLSQLSGIQALWDLDATIAASYGGSGQTWSNLIASPDDGAAQTAYDFFRGATSSSAADDPTFNGTVGDAAANWSLDGGDMFQIAAGNTATLKNLHKTTGSGPLTLMIAFRTPATIATAALTGTVGAGSTDGWLMLLQSATILRATQKHASSGSSTNFTVSFSAGTDYLAAMAFDFTAGTIKAALNARTFTGGTLAKGADTTDAASAFQIGASGTSSNVGSGTLIYGCYGFNKLLSDTDLGNVVTLLNARHNKTYA